MAAPGVLEWQEKKNLLRVLEGVGCFLFGESLKLIAVGEPC